MKTTTRRGMLILLAASLAACSQDAPSQARAPLPATLVLEPGIAVSVAGTDLQLRFIEIVSDSRCPRGVTCVWAGEVRVRLSVRSGNTPASQHEVIAGNALPVGAYLIAVEKVEPEPVEDRKISPRDYRVTVRVEMAQS
jgi:hypothetical protein